MAKRRRQARQLTPKKRRPKSRPASRRKPAPVPQRPSPAPLGPTIPGLSPDSATAAVQWAPLDPLDVKCGGADQRDESIVLTASTVPVSMPRPARSRGRRPEAARDCALAVLVRRRHVELADLIRAVQLKPSSPSVMRSFLRMLANGKMLLEAKAALPPDAKIVAAWDAGGYPGDTGALVWTLLPHLRRLPGVPLGKAQLSQLLAPPRPDLM